MLTSSAPAKIILCGEHAVVYGQPAIALPVSQLRAYASVSAHAPELILCARDLNNQIIRPRTEPEHPLSQLTDHVLQALQVMSPAVQIDLYSDIPIASGMGSGAATATALARALLAALGCNLTDEQLNTIVFEIEKLHHGTPSGIDNTVIVYEQAIWFRHGQPIQPIAVGAELDLLIADTGVAASTMAAVADVRRLHDSDPQAIGAIFDQIGELAHLARNALEMGDLAAMGALMNHNHQLLQALNVSSPELDHLVDAAVKAGAAGAKLSGGGRGGNMIALVHPEKREQIRIALLEAGAAAVYNTLLKRTV